MQLRGNKYGKPYTAEEVLNTFQAIADSNNFSSKTSKRYIVASRKLIRKSSLFSFQDTITVIRSMYSGHKKIYNSRCGADSIRVKNNLIAFYRKDERVVKVFQDAESLENYISGISHFTKSNPSAFTVSDICNYSFHPVVHTVEKLIYGSSLSKPVTFSREHIKDLLTFHFGDPEFRVRKFSESECKILEKVLRRISLTDDAQTLVDKIRTDGYTILSTYGDAHGELSRGNILESKNRNVILDWDGFGQDFIAEDICKIWLQSDDETKRRIILNYNHAQNKAAESLLTQGKTPNHFGVQVFFAILNKVVRLHSKTYDYLLLRDGSQNKADKSLERIELKLQRGLNMLPTFM